MDEKLSIIRLVSKNTIAYDYIEDRKVAYLSMTGNNVNMKLSNKMLIKSNVTKEHFKKCDWTYTIDESSISIIDEVDYAKMFRKFSDLVICLDNDFAINYDQYIILGNDLKLDSYKYTDFYRFIEENPTFEITDDFFSNSKTKTNKYNNRRSLV